MRKTNNTPQARAVRDKILARADWILESSIRAACGYVPVLPPDMVDFTVDRDAHRMVPELKPLGDLLKAVMPVMKLEDDRNEIALQAAIKARDAKRLSHKEQAEEIVNQCMRGEISHAESLRMLDALKPMMEMDSRQQIITAMERLS